MPQIASGRNQFKSTIDHCRLAHCTVAFRYTPPPSGHWLSSGQYRPRGQHTQTAQGALRGPVTRPFRPPEREHPQNRMLLVGSFGSSTATAVLDVQQHSAVWRLVAGPIPFIRRQVWLITITGSRSSLPRYWRVTLEVATDLTGCCRSS